MTGGDDIAALAAEVFSDFRKFAGLLEIRLKGSGTRPFTFDSWFEEQRQFEAERTGRDLVLKGRQIGFSTEELARDLFYVLTHDGVQVLVVSHDKSEVERMFEDARAWVNRLVELRLIPKPRFSTKRELTWKFNRSTMRVVEAGKTKAAAQGKGRSGTIHRAHLTEVAFWGAAVDAATAISAAVPASGEIVWESTPNGAAGLFYEMCTTALEGTGSYRLHFFPWWRHPEYRVTPGPDFDPRPPTDAQGKPDTWETRLRELGCDDAQIAWWRAKLADPASGGLERVLQEYPIDATSCFRMPGGAYIDAPTCDWLATKVRKPIRTVPIVVTHKVGGVEQTKRLGELRIFAEPLPGRTYVIGADVAEGVARDESALDVMDRRTGETCATYASDDIEPGDFGLVLAWSARLYNNALVAPERNNHGHTVLRTLSAEQTSVTPYGYVYEATDGRRGWKTDPATRPPMFDDLAQACRDRVTSSPDASFAAQSRTLVRDKRGKPLASGKGTTGGAKDDRWIARAIAWQLRQRPTRPGEQQRRTPYRSEADRLGDLI